MSELVQQLIKYFNETPEKRLKEELEELEPYNKIGPDVLEYMKNTKKNGKDI